MSNSLASRVVSRKVSKREVDNLIDRSMLNWLLAGDPSIRWQVMRDLLLLDAQSVDEERAKIAREGWGAQLLSFQKEDGTWGGGIYSPKWISTTYSLLFLRECGMRPLPPTILGCEQLWANGLYNGEEIRFSKKQDRRDIGVSALVTELFCYFGFRTDVSGPLIRFIVSTQNDDGSWFYDHQTGAETYAFETTFLALKALQTCKEACRLRIDGLEEAERKGRAFLLRAHLYQNSVPKKGGESSARLPLKRRWIDFAYPNYWFYDLMSALDYFRPAGIKDDRMRGAIDIVRGKQTSEGMWLLSAPHPGKVFFEMETPGKPSRWNTLRALRILKWWDAT